MPLHIDIRINGRLIDQIHIGRTQKLVTITQTHRYLVVRGIHDAPDVPYDSEGVAFTHRYDEGALVCVQKAIEAWLSALPKEEK